MNYLRYLKNAKLINLLYANGNEDLMKKPARIYLQNTNLLNSVAPENNDNATYRQTFFYNQAGYRNHIKSVDGFDFNVKEKYNFTVGGKHIEPATPDGYTAADRIEIGSGRKIPLWLFGFGY
jgi:hypothetical protein